MTAKDVRELLRLTRWTLRELGEAVQPRKTERTALNWKKNGCYSKVASRQLDRFLEEARRAKAS